MHIGSILPAIEYVYINMISSSLVRSYCKMFIAKLTRSEVLEFGRRQMGCFHDVFSILIFMSVLFISCHLQNDTSKRLDPFINSFNS